MKIEKINENQIRCTLNKYDLASRQIKISELAYGTDKAKRLFKDMMQQASAEFGFEAEDIPLMIEAIPISADCIILMITKVEDPEELDTRFSRFVPSEDDDDGDTLDPDLNSVLQAASECLDIFAQRKPDAVTPDSGSFIPLPETLGIKKDIPKAPAKVEHQIPTAAKPMETIFSFSTLDDVIRLAIATKGGYTASNSLYKSIADDRYYLMVSQDSMSQEKFAIMCNLLSEYGRIERFNYATKSFFDEHCKKIIAKKALQKLSTIGN